ncbi:helix-turn-helix domain-containing protein [Erwinia papayae]|uniref:Helix-turn-helix domain-containing protein n=1 Tax=Erwinia papayae TaxID=206499 RepID=A0ABV3N3H7_9GAMM
MRTDNIEHKTLFSIPEPSFSNVVALRKPLPPQRKITGHKQTDAYLWVLEVIQLNEPAHLQAAEDALAKLTISPKEAQQRYSDHLMKSGAHPFQIVFGTMSMDNPAKAIKAAKSAIEEASRVRSLFGSYEQALENTEAENLMLVGKIAAAYEGLWGWNEEEKEQGWMDGGRSMEIDKLRKEMSKGFADQLPQPHTLSDVVREYEYWSWLCSLRDRAAKELGDTYGDYERRYIYDREDYLENLLTIIRPVTRQEAIEVCRWVLANERFEIGGGDTDKIMLNLVGECEV